jgi:hypothetical protein
MASQPTEILHGFSVAQTRKGKKLYHSRYDVMTGEWRESKIGYVVRTEETPERITWTLLNGEQYFKSK